MRVLLINPPYPVCESLTMPLGLLYLAARLEEGGHEVALEDMQLCNAPVARLRRNTSGPAPHIIGLTSFSMNLHLAGKIGAFLKKLYPEAVTVWGGSHVSFDDVKTLQDHPWVDVIARGEGEETLLEIATSLMRRRGFEGISGITWRQPGGGLQRNPPRPFRENLDSLPRPAWHLLQLSKYKAFGEGASVITSRGCPHRCVFCVGRKMIGARGRFRNPVKVVDEIEALAQMGFRRLRIEDDLFTFHKVRALAICRELERRALQVKWRAYARVDTVDPELLSWMARTGCERLLFGAESGSPEILRLIRKGITPEQTRRAVEAAQAAGIGVLASFVLGLPGETHETLNQTLEFAESLNVPYTLNALTPYVGTEIREKAEEWQIRIRSDDWRLYGQGAAVTGTPFLSPRHISAAIGRYRRRLKGYLEDLTKAEKADAVSPAQADELEKFRRWDFLRQIIREDRIERCRKAPDAEGNKVGGLTRILSAELQIPESHIASHLARLIADGHITAFRLPGGGWEWRWN